MRRRSFRQASDLPQAQNEAAKQLLFELFPSAISMTEIRQELAKSFEAPAGTTGVQQASQLGMCVCVCVCVCVCIQLWPWVGHTITVTRVNVTLGVLPVPVLAGLQRELEPAVHTLA